jgi:hypothetical protein
MTDRSFPSDRAFLDEVRRNRDLLDGQNKQGQLTIEKSREILKRMVVRAGPSQNEPPTLSKTEQDLRPKRA